MKNCNEIKELMSLYIDNELDAELRSRFEEHLKGCDDCQKELDELKEIISLCGSLEEEELPEDFKQQLHEKLLSVNENNGFVETRKTKKLPFSRYIRIGTTIAAVILVAVMLKVLFPLSGVSTKNDEASQVADSALRSSAAQEREAGAENNSASYDMGNEDQTVVTSDAADTYAGSVQPKAAKGSTESAGSTGKVEKPSARQAPSEVQKGKEKKQETECKEEAVMFNKAVDQEQLLTLTGSVVNAIRDTDVTVKVENPEEETDKIKAKALEFGAEFREVKAIDGAGGDLKNGSESINLVFRMPNEQYNLFLEVLKAEWGEDFVITGNTKTVDMDPQIKDLEKKLEDLKKRIESLEAEDEPKTDEIDTLKTERESVQKELDNLLRDVKYISVCVEIINK